MNPAKTLFYRNWPIVVGLIAFILLAAWLDAHDRPACLVKTHEEIYVDFQGRTKQQYIVIEAGTSEQQLSHYEIVLGPRGEIKWKDLWKLRSKAEMTSKNTLAQTAFVNKDQEAPFPEHIFRADHPFSFQCWICASLRSRARPTGRCGLQPRRTRSFQTWPW